MKIGSFKVVIAGDTASVKELLVRKSADYAGRPPLHSFMRSTFGMLSSKLQYVIYRLNIEIRQFWSCGARNSGKLGLFGTN